MCPARALTPSLREELVFLVTNRIPRRYATLLMGWFSSIESRRLARLTIAVWRRFADLRLDEAETREFTSLRACFTRRLRPGVRPIDAAGDVVVSPCDGIVGACGRIDDTTLVQAKGLTYTLEELLRDRALAARHRGGTFVTLRLTPAMYHRFHAPCDGRLTSVRYVAGDTWNVNPVTVRRVAQLFCRNERAVLDVRLTSASHALTLVPVAAILVAGIVLHALPDTLDLRYRGDDVIACDASFAKGDELGFFQHGSTILVLASCGFAPCASVVEGRVVRMGEPLLRLHGTPLSAPPPSSPS
ncbi:MAG: phosphatidylserine decarboxylase [Gemmatirosa sp.]|nr:phosphatidylserine decarboxylase [Gemmatirosa sp.]